MKTLTFILFNISLIFVSCSNDNSESVVQNVNKQVSLQQENLNITTFKEIPKEIDGYACYLFNSEKDKQDSEYLCIGIFEIFVYVSINEKLEKFELIEKKENKNNNGNDYFYFNPDKTLKLKVEVKFSPADYETSNIRGTLMLEKKEAQPVVRDFMGYCSE